MNTDDFDEEPSSTTNLSNLSKCFKVVMVGDGGTGKSSYVSKLNDGTFLKEYIATLGIEKHSVSILSNFGEHLVEIYDTAGQEKCGSLRDGYYLGSDAAIIFFDVTSRVTYKNIAIWHRDINRICPNIPIVICANKIDIKERKVKKKNINYHLKFCMEYFELSVKENINLKEPLQYLLQQITKEVDLRIEDSLSTNAFQFNTITLKEKKNSPILN